MKFLHKVINFLCPLPVFVFFSCSDVPRSSMEQNETPPEIVFYNQGNAFSQQGDYHKALKEYNAALAINPREPLIHFNLGYARHRLLLYREAINAYEKALELDPSLSQAWLNIALAHDSLGQKEKSYLAYQKYRELSIE